MPLVTIHYRHDVLGTNQGLREDVARLITKWHRTCFDTPVSAVKIAFLPLAPHEGFSAGSSFAQWIRVTAEVPKRIPLSTSAITTSGIGNHIVSEARDSVVGTITIGLTQRKHLPHPRTKSEVSSTAATVRVSSHWKRTFLTETYSAVLKLLKAADGPASQAADIQIRIVEVDDFEHLFTNGQFGEREGLNRD